LSTTSPRTNARELVAALAGVAGLAAGVNSLARLGRAGRGGHRLGPGDPGGVRRDGECRRAGPGRGGAGRGVRGRAAGPGRGRGRGGGGGRRVRRRHRDRSGSDRGAGRGGPVPRPGVAGKAAACAHGARVSTAGRWLAFVDADVVLAPEALSRLLAACLAAGAAAGSPLARQATRTWWEELLLPDLGLAVAERLDLDAGRRPGPTGRLPVRAVPAGQAGRLRRRGRVRGRGRVAGRGRRPGRPAQGGRAPSGGPPGPRPGRRAHVRALRRPVGGAGQEPGRGLGGRDGPAGLAGGPDGRPDGRPGWPWPPGPGRRPGGSPWPAACSS
jgi:hypothetical protein